MNAQNKTRKPLTCNEAQGYLTGLLHADLTPGLQGRVEAHLLFCKDCSEAWGLVLDKAIELGEIKAPEITSIPPVPTGDGAAASVPERSRLFGALWKILREKAAQGENSAQHKLESLREDLNSLARGWQPAFVRVLGPSGSGTAQAQMLDDAYELAHETLELKVMSAPAITPDGRFDARFAAADETLSGRTVALTICDQTKMLVTFTSTLRPGAVGQLEAVFAEEGFDLPPSIIGADNFILHIWPEQK